MGDCGTGKSTVVEKMSGRTGLSSNSKTSHSHHQLRVTSMNGRFCIVDTPGQNALKGALEDNMEVAMALNGGPVSLLLLTVKAEPRLEAVIEQAEKYCERFVEFSDLFCICVTN